MGQSKTCFFGAVCVCVCVRVCVCMWEALESTKSDERVHVLVKTIRKGHGEKLEELALVQNICVVCGCVRVV